MTLLLQPLLLGCEFAEIGAAQPIAGDFKFQRRFPMAFAQAVLADRWIGLGFAERETNRFMVRPPVPS